MLIDLNKKNQLLQEANKLPEHSLERARLLRDAAWECIHFGYFLEAEELLSRAVSIYEAADEAANGAGVPYRHSVSNTSVTLAEALCDLGLMQWRLAQFAKSEVSYQRALSIRVLIYGDAHPCIGEVYSDIAGVYRCQGRYSLASEKLEKALQIQKQALGDDHPDVATTLRNQAALMRDQEQGAEVEYTAHRAIAIYDNAYGKDSLEALCVSKVLDLFYYSTGNYKEGKRTSHRTLEVMTSLLDNRHPLVAGCLLNAGHYKMEQDLAAAGEFYQRAYDIYQDCYRGNHPFVALSLYYMSLTGVGVKLSKGSFSAKEKALAIFDCFYEPLNPLTHKFVTGLAEEMYETGRLEEAEKLCHRALGISEKRDPIDYVCIVSDLVNLSDVQFYSEAYPEAEKLLLEALSTLEEKEPKEARWLKEVLEKLARTYEKLGNEDKAVEMKARLGTLGEV